MLAGFVLCYLSVKLFLLFPQFTFPEPTGKFAVSSTYFLFRDTTRTSIYNKKIESYRISVKLWYPAVGCSESQYQYYHTEETAEGFASLFNLPAFIFDYLTKIKTHTCYNTQPVITESPFPLVIYSPSSGMNQTTAINEELASHGFVVMAVGHEDTEPFMYGPGGKIIMLNYNNPHHLKMREELNSSKVELIKDRIINCENIEDKHRLQSDLNDAQPFNMKDIKNRARDIGFVIDKLIEINNTLSGIVDTNKTGIYGFSKGGATAGEVCVNNNKINAGINLDGFMYGDILFKPLAIPFMFMQSVPSDPDAFINDMFYEKAEGDSYMLKIKGTAHPNFGDLSLFGGIFKDRGILGPIDGLRSVEIQRAYILAFFEKYLKGSDSGLLTDDTLPYPEVEIYMKKVQKN